MSAGIRREPPWNCKALPQLIVDAADFRRLKTDESVT
jgi:hypothetical protein